MIDDEQEVTALFESVVRDCGWTLAPDERQRLLQGFVMLRELKACVAEAVDEAAEPSNVHHFDETRGIA